VLNELGICVFGATAGLSGTAISFGQNFRERL
jgi:hypothetical protein